MNKVICKRLELINPEDVEVCYQNTITLKRGKQFSDLLLDQSEYTSQSKETDGGSVLNETVTVRLRYSEDLPFLKSPLKYFILRVHTNKDSFLVGSPEYPAILTYSTDRIHVNLTFKATKPQ